MGSDIPSRGSLLGLAGLASLCCVGPGTATVAGGTSVGMIGGIVQGAVIFAVLGFFALLFRLWSGCSCSIRSTERDTREFPERGAKR